jgi:hypothetical protein
MQQIAARLAVQPADRRTFLPPTSDADNGFATVSCGWPTSARGCHAASGATNLEFTGLTQNLGQL